MPFKVAISRDGRTQVDLDNIDDVQFLQMACEISPRSHKIAL